MLVCDYITYFQVCQVLEELAGARTCERSRTRPSRLRTPRSEDEDVLFAPRLPSPLAPVVAQAGAYGYLPGDFIGRQKKPRLEPGIFSPILRKPLFPLPTDDVFGVARTRSDPLDPSVEVGARFRGIHLNNEGK